MRPKFSSTVLATLCLCGALGCLHLGSVTLGDPSDKDRLNSLEERVTNLEKTVFETNLPQPASGENPPMLPNWTKEN
jgi:hypothetical protein